MSWTRMLQLPVGSLVVFYCGFTCRDWWQELVGKKNFLIFLGTSKNAVLTQIWIALSVSLVPA